MIFNNTALPEERAACVLANAKMVVELAEELGVCLSIERKIDPLNPGKAEHVIEVWPSRALRDKG